LHGDAWQGAQKIQQAIRDETQLPCSIGVARTYLVAKVASDLAKPRGLLWVPPGAEAAFLAPLPVRRIPGIGQVTEKALAALGIHTIGELAQVERDRLEKEFGRWGEALYRKARGEDSDLWFVDEEQKSISHERTFDEDTADRMKLEAALAHLAQLVAQRLRAEKLYARTITLKLRYASFQTLTREHTLPEATNLDRTIFETARQLFERHWQASRAVRLLGVAASNLVAGPGQLSLLEESQRVRQEELARAADRLRARHGADAVRSARTLLRKRRQ
jgi:DNA polymerase-4